MDTLLQDLRYAVRALLRSRSFTALAVLCLALGIGTNTAVFSVVNTLLLRPLPIRDPDRVLMLYTRQDRQGIDDASFSVADLLDVRAQSTTLADVAGMYEGGFNLAGGDGEPERVKGMGISANLFPLIGVSPARGRNFLPREDRPGGELVVILSDALWRRMGARPGLVGSTVLVSGKPRVVVGVMPPRFNFPTTAELWVPMQTDPTEARSERYVWTIARLKPGATLDGARAELAGLARRLEAANPGTNAGWSFGAKLWREEFVENGLKLTLYLMMGAVGFVLLIACANVANLLLARSVGRQREIAIRAAVGAARGRIVRQLLTESVLVALAGGALGVLIAVWWIAWVTSRIPERMAYWITFDVDWRVLAYTLTLSVATGVVFGLLPALRASRPDLTGALREGTRGAGSGGARNRVRGTLVAGEIALSLILLVGATLMIRSFLAAVGTDMGFDTRPLLALRTSLTGERYDRVEARAAAFRQLAGRIAALPGARGAAWTTALPGDDGGTGLTLVAEGQPRAPGEEIAGRGIGITPEFFSTVGKPLLAGRTFSDREAADSASRVAIVNHALAEQLWPGRDPVGRRIQLTIGPAQWYTVVGVAPDLQYEEVGEVSAQSRRQVYVPYAVYGWHLMVLMVRSAGDPGALAPAVRREIRGADPTLPVFDLRTMDEYRAYTTWDKRLFGELFGTFALLAILLAAVGVYGVMAYVVSQRTHEIGIRMALGAERGDVLRLVVGRGLAVAAAGVGVGLLGAFGASRAMRSILYGVTPDDPATFLGVPLFLLGIALLASYLPARRAARVDPMVALRSE
ncbi:MAG: ABC transporter permease [Gemmatimonadetes bacterium]|nr:ABC transporter permease [Gemmatimonadota bacterium]